MPQKHVGEELRGIIKKVRDSSFDYEHREKAETNWAKYDSAQIKEMANYLDNLRDIVDEANNRIRSRTIPVKRGPIRDRLRYTIGNFITGYYDFSTCGGDTAWQKGYNNQKDQI